MTPMLLGALILVLLTLAVLGDLAAGRGNNEVKPRLVRAPPPGGTLFVLVHGFKPEAKPWEEVAAALEPYGGVLLLTYDARRASNAAPAALSSEIGKAIAAEVAQRPGARVVLVAHSIGALLVRRAVLDGLSQKQSWAQAVRRLVLLAGMNRGWTTEGKLPPDATVWLELQMRVGHWLAKLLGRGELILEMQRGSPFVSNLRLDWIRLMHEREAAPAADPRPLEVVQLLGDIDDVVHREDNEDLRATAMGEFALLRVRGTGHADIIEVGASGKDEEASDLQLYRRDKLLLAATTQDFGSVRAQSEVLEPSVDKLVTDVVFVLHGIRDIGRWSSAFEDEIRNNHGLEADRKLLFVSPRYGYLGMGPFLFEGVRDRYVRWFMDEYTEVLARYPRVKPESIRFFGHSNGTYLLADALRKYESMRVGNVVLAGSVVSSDYPWSGLEHRIGAIRSYAGTRDWVVALFPRLFELPGFVHLGNRLGGGGFLGFSDTRVQNVLIPGGHDAFGRHQEAIVAFLMTEGGQPPIDEEGNPLPLPKDRSVLLHAMASMPVVLLVWASLMGVVCYIGLRVVGAAAAPNWPILLVFALLLVTVLRTI